MENVGSQDTRFSLQGEGAFVGINVKSCEIRPLVDGEGIGSGNNESNDWFQHFCPIITRVTQTQSEMITYYETPCCRKAFDHLIPVAGPAHHSRPGLDCWYQCLEILVKKKINKSCNLIIIRCCLRVTEIQTMWLRLSYSGGKLCSR